MFSSLLVVVILGAVTAQITRWCLVGAQPATVGLSSHRAGGMLPSLVGGDTGLRTDADVEPVVVEVVEPAEAPDRLAVDDAVPLALVDTAVVETTATSWVSRGRAVVGLTLVVSALGAVLAMAVASTALLTAAVLDSALG